MYALSRFTDGWSLPLVHDSGPIQILPAPEGYLGGQLQSLQKTWDKKREGYKEGRERTEGSKTHKRERQNSFLERIMQRV